MIVRNSVKSSSWFAVAVSMPVNQSIDQPTDRPTDRSNQSNLFRHVTLMSQKRLVTKMLSYQREVDKGKLTTVASFAGKADVSSVSPLSEQSGGLWVVCVFIY